MESLNTYHKLINLTADNYPLEPVFGYRKYDYVENKSDPHYSYITYNEMIRIKNSFASGLLHLLKSNPFKDISLSSHQKIDNHELNYKSYNAKNHSFILTLFASNRWEWNLTDLATSSYSITNTALYDTLGPDASNYILELTESPVVVASKEHVRDLIELKKVHNLKNLILIISLDPLLSEDGDLKNLAKEQNIQIFEFNQVIKFGEIIPLLPLEPTPETLYTISFTSGTTGSKPKGVELTQKIATSGITFVLSSLPHEKGVKSFSFLPLAHIFERQVAAFHLVCGGCIGYPQFNGTPLTLLEDLKIFKPNAMANVPRVFTKFEAVLKENTINSKSSIKRKLFNHIINYKFDQQSIKDGEEGNHFIYDKLFISKLRSALGFDNMRFVITGSAPISVPTIQFLKASLGVGMAQGYGLTESFAGFAMSKPYECQPGTCGSTSITVEMRVKELPTMGYYLNDPRGARGELQLRGPQIFKAYYKNLDETKKALSDDGWFSTGDVANISSDGKLSIIDRVKNFFKLAQGEYVTPEKVENQYLSGNSNIIQCYAHGDSLRHFLVGVIGIEKGVAKDFLATRNISQDNLINDDDILREINKKDIRKEILTILNSNIKGLQGFEKLHNIFIEFEPLTLARNVVTPTMKLKRPLALKFFSKQIGEMYDEGSLIKAGKL